MILTINRVERLGTSYYGNPYFKLYTDEGIFRTKIDASINYAIENYRPGDVVEVKLTRAGRIEAMKPFTAA